MQNNTLCTIEHHAVLFALLSKNAIILCDTKGEEAILAGMTRYGKERGRRMAANAIANGDELTLVNSQAYGEWRPDFDGQMTFGQLRLSPTFRTYISKCAWCDAWNKHDLLEYGKLYCVDVDNAVYQGFRSDFVCTPLSTAMSWGGTQCEFDWGRPLTEEEARELADKKAALGTSCMKDFNFHTAHLLHTIGNTIRERCPQEAEQIIQNALDEYTNKFGQQYLDVLAGKYPPS